MSTHTPNRDARRLAELRYSAATDDLSTDERAELTRLSRRGFTVPQLVALAIVGALIGLWISPGRAYAAPAPQQLAAHTIEPCAWEDGSGQVLCVWAGHIMGDGVGRSAVVRHGGTDRMTFRYISSRNAERLLVHGFHYSATANLTAANLAGVR